MAAPVKARIKAVVMLLLDIGIAALLLWGAMSVPDEKHWTMRSAAWVVFIYYVFQLADSAIGKRRKR